VECAAAGFGLRWRFLAGFSSDGRRRLRCRGLAGAAQGDLNWRYIHEGRAYATGSRSYRQAASDKCRGLRQPSLTC
jgi:hypothetical protein